MDLSRVTLAKKLADGKFLLQIKQDNLAFQGFNPLSSFILTDRVEFVCLLLCHKNEAMHTVTEDVLEVDLLQPAVLHVEDASLLIIVLRLCQIIKLISLDAKSFKD